MAQDNSQGEQRLYFAYGSNLSTAQMQHRCPLSTPLGLAHLPDWTVRDPKASASLLEPARALLMKMRQWIINERGYANIVAPDSPALASSLQSADAEVSSRVPAVDRVEDIAQANDVHDPSWDYPPRAASGPGVYGLVYRLHPLDEDALDGYEGVPFAYDREILEAVWVEVPGSNSVPISSRNSTNTTSRIAFKELARGTEADSSGGAASFATGKMFEALVYVDRLRVTPSTPKGEYVHRMNSGIEEALTEWGLPAAYVDEVMRPYIPAP